MKKAIIISTTIFLLYPLFQLSLADEAAWNDWCDGLATCKQECNDVHINVFYDKCGFDKPARLTINRHVLTDERDLIEEINIIDNYSLPNDQNRYLLIDKEVPMNLLLYYFTVYDDTENIIEYNFRCEIDVIEGKDCHEYGCTCGVGTNKSSTILFTLFIMMAIGLFFFIVSQYRSIRIQKKRNDGK